MTPHQGRSELHRHRDEVLMSGGIAAPDMGPIPRIRWPIRLLANESHLRPIVRQLDSWVCKKAHQVPTVMVPAEFIEQPLIVPILQALVPQLIRQLCLQGFGIDFEVGHHPIVGRVPQS
jgi:hypothetical protein